MASKNIALTAQKRDKTGRKVKALRREGIAPANVFGKGIDSVSIQVDSKEFIKTYKKAGETSVIDLTIEGQKDIRPVLVSNLQVHPVTGDLLHIDLYQVDLTQKVTAAVPLEFVGESPAVKDLDGVLITTMSEIDVETLPSDIPEKFELDISVLVEIGNTITVGDIKVNKDLVTLLAEDEEPIALIQMKKVQEEEPEEEPEDGEEDGEDSQEDSKSEEKKDSGEDASEKKPEEK